MKQIGNTLIILCGNAILAFCIAAFIEPTDIICGGTTGIGLAVQHWLGIPLFVTVCIVNIITFGIGAAVLGKNFALTTVLSTFTFPLWLNFFEHMKFLAHLTDDMLLNAILAGVVSGLGVGIVFKTGASTGGLDIPPLVAKKLFEVPVGLGMMVTNCLSLALQIPFLDIERILYGLVNTVVMSLVLNRVLLLGAQQAQLMIFSPQFEAIRARLLQEDNGVTMVQIETGMTRIGQKAVLCVVPMRKLTGVKQCIQEIDEQSFIIISTITEVRGKGFSFAREQISSDHNTNF